jgi:hypothetical protein
MAREERARNGPLSLGLIVLVLAFAATYLRSTPPEPLPADAPAVDFSAGRAHEVLSALVGDGDPHPIGTDANARVRARIVQHFRTLGYTTEIQTTFACSGIDNACGTVNNIIARPPGTGSGRVVLLVSHYDSVAAGPGASDAGVSVAAILEVARAIASDADHRNRVVFLVDDGEEAGLLGASGFVAGHPLAREVGAVVNLEARGTSGPSVMFETSGDNAWLVGLLSRSLRQPMASSLFYPIYERLPNDTDLTVFKQAGMPGVNFAFIGDVARYHTPLDDVAHARPASLQHQGENALAIVRALADADLGGPAAGNAVFFDVLGFGIVSWPVGLTVALAVTALVLVAIATVLMRRLTVVTFGQTLVGLLAWVTAIGATALATWRMLVSLGARGAWPGGATTQADTWVLAFWLVGLALAVIVLAVLGRWSTGPGAWAGCWLAWSMTAIAAAVYFPEASYVFIVPALLAGVLGIVAVTLRSRPPGAIASALPLAAASVLLMPPAWMLFDALGPTALPVVGTAIAVVCTALAPSVARAGRMRWVVPVMGFAAAGALSVTSLQAPAFSADLPERMNITFFQLAGNARARWIVSPQSGVLPDAMRGAAAFGDDMVPGFPWSSASTSFVADVRPTSMREPVVDVIERREDNGRTMLRLRAMSPRRAHVLTLLLPAARMVSVRFDGTVIPPRPGETALRLSQRDTGGSFRAYSCFTVPDDGLEIDLVVDGTGPIEGYVIGQSPGLPQGGQALAAARPASATASRQGDITVLASRIRF